MRSGRSRRPIMPPRGRQCDSDRPRWPAARASRHAAGRARPRSTAIDASPGACRGRPAPPWAPRRRSGSGAAGGGRSGSSVVAARARLHVGGRDDRAVAVDEGDRQRDAACSASRTLDVAVVVERGTHAVVAAERRVGDPHQALLALRPRCRPAARSRSMTEPSGADVICTVDVAGSPSARRAARWPGCRSRRRVGRRWS